MSSHTSLDNFKADETVAQTLPRRCLMKLKWAPKVVTQKSVVRLIENINSLEAHPANKRMVFNARFRRAK